MNIKYSVQSADEWSALPEVALPSLKGSQSKGSVYSVHKIGFLGVSKDQCQKAGISAEVSRSGKCLLPTVVIEFSGSPKLCRLPLELSSWAFECVVHARSGLLAFPTRVEFGILKGRGYAEIILEQQ